ncbi:MAG: NAD(P)H-dependent oxidoreductase subunit E [Deltaproteobacteria bacterium]|jgi:NADH-quinone oxidoreductase subunit E|nr:NAD(P)H-dependent oxidoreductase subunit E [Deltaproteobacteria bacterium]
MNDAPENFLQVIESYPKEPRLLLPILQAIQAQCRHLPEEALKAVALRLSLPLSRVYAVSRFYRALSLTPKGDKLVKVCLGTACHLRGAPRLIERLEERLEIKMGETDPKGRYSLESVNCLGACALAPVVTVDELVYGKLTPKTIKEIRI